LALFFLAYQGYQLVRGAVGGRSDIAFANAERIVDLEKSLGTFFEPGFQQALLSHTWLIDFANWMYVNSHFTISVVFLAWLYLFRNDNFYFVRNMFMVAMGIALVGYVLFPTAPPRMLTAEGFTDTIATFTSVNQDGNAVSLLVNKYAAVPSMHIGFSSMIAGTAVMLVRNPVGKVLWALYPLLVFWVIVVTGNHYWFDAAAGLVVAGCSALVASRVLAPVRPAQWAFRPVPEEATA
jgi:membrane-associated phospholipid phosphatase